MIAEAAMAAVTMLVGGDALRGLALANGLATTAPGKYVVLYDGHCRFCTAQSRNVEKLAKAGTLELVSFQEPGVLERFPGVTHEACMEAMHLITPSGRVYRGLEAAIRAVSTRKRSATLRTPS